MDGKVLCKLQCPDTSQVHSSIPQTPTSCPALSGLGCSAGMAEPLGKTHGGEEAVGCEQVMAATQRDTGMASEVRGGSREAGELAQQLEHLPHSWRMGFGARTHVGWVTTVVTPALSYPGPPREPVLMCTPPKKKPHIYT